MQCQFRQILLDCLTILFSELIITRERNPHHISMWFNCNRFIQKWILFWGFTQKDHFVPTLMKSYFYMKSSPMDPLCVLWRIGNPFRKCVYQIKRNFLNAFSRDQQWFQRTHHSTRTHNPWCTYIVWVWFDPKHGAIHQLLPTFHWKQTTQNSSFFHFFYSMK